MSNTVTVPADKLAELQRDLAYYKNIAERYTERMLQTAGTSGPAGDPEVTGLTLDANEAHFLAARLRRLFAHVALPLPTFATDDARLIGIAGSAIGMLLTRWETEGPTWHAVISNAAPGINRAICRADVADEYADKCRRDGYTGVEVVPLYAVAAAQPTPTEGEKP